MPTKPRRPCAHRGCPSLTAERYCPAHAAQARAQAEVSRGTATERGYDGTWARMRMLKLNEVPLCQRCEIKGLSVIAVLVHHRDRNPRNNQADNLESLCVPCHDEEHAGERWRGKVEKNVPR